jgi:hypothetical protein
MVLTMIAPILILLCIAGAAAVGVVHFRPRIGFLQPLYAWLEKRDGTLAAPPVPAAAAGPAPAPPPMPAPPAAPPRRFTAPSDVVAGGPLPSGGSAAQGDALMAINSLVAEAYHGPLKNVHLVIATLSAIQDGTGKGLVSLGRRLAETDKDYGSAIWEPVVEAGFQAQHGAMKLAEADAGLSVLAHTTVGEASQNPAIHVPHNSQLNGAA